ncbi:MAG: iron dicitrate transport regulator FecR [Planctomycetota bacterium]
MAAEETEASKVLIQRYLLGEASEAEVTELESLLESSEDLRREFVRCSQLDVIGREVAIEQSVLEGALPLAGRIASNIESTRSKSRFRDLILVAAAAVVVLSLLPLRWWSTDSSVATIVSSENAAWESSLPTMPGDQLAAGTLHLKTGVATIRFGEGAELLMEAPATLELISAMRCRLQSGAAVVNVPETSIGFVVETPGGYAEDFGTSFAIRVDDSERRSDFELIDGEIAVHHEPTGDSVRLTQSGAAVIVSNDSIRRVEDVTARSDESVKSEKTLVIGTDGRCGTAMPRFEKRWKFIDPTILSVKRTASGKWDYRSFFSFDVSDIDLDQVADVRLRLNLLPSQRGLASRLPKVNRFGIYGLTNKAKFNWEIESRWEESPSAEDGSLLGTFEIARSQTRGVFGIDGKALLEFLKSHSDKPVTFILVRETTQIEGVGPGLTHMFASDSHPESVGPQLELTLK